MRAEADRPRIQFALPIPADRTRYSPYDCPLDPEVSLLNCYYSPLPGEALLHIDGPDALTFLQGQTTCDTRPVGPARAALGAYCTPQGRVVCDFLLAALGPEHVVLRMRREVREHAAGVLGKYIVFSRAELDAARDDWQVAAVWGPDAAALIGAVFGSAPGAAMACVSGADFTVVQTNDSATAFECYLGPDSPWSTALGQAVPETGEAAWRAAQIRAGLARIEAATADKFVPQVLNYDLTGHINFKKGCYTGQEVVARLHYRGTSKRRSFLATLPREAGAGDPVFDRSGEKNVGDVVNCAVEGDAIVALVSATTEAAASGLCLQPGGSAPLTLGELPYPVLD